MPDTGLKFSSKIVEAEVVLDRLLEYAYLKTYSVQREELTDRLADILPIVKLDGKEYLDLRLLRISRQKWRKIYALAKETQIGVIVHVHRQKDEQQQHELKIYPAGFNLVLDLTGGKTTLTRILGATVEDDVLTMSIDGTPISRT